MNNDHHVEMYGTYVRASRQTETERETIPILKIPIYLVTCVEKETEPS